MRSALRTALFALLASLFSASVWGTSILDSRHNLSTTGPGPIKSDSEGEVCIFCHAPHRARRDVSALWNRADPQEEYTTYDSSTMRATVGQPTGASALCLSCHDGTIALGAVLSRRTEISFPVGMRFLTEDNSTAYLGTDLSDDHPVSFSYQEALDQGHTELVPAGFLPDSVRLDREGQLQCTACHDPHNDDYGKFLVMDNRHAALCTSCHAPSGWEIGAHAGSTATWNGLDDDPWPDTEYTTVAENACANCHRPHRAGGRERLLHYEVEAANCVVCHSGNVAEKDIVAELSKNHGHFVQDYAGLHDAAEDYLAAMDTHVECVDCHNPHRANADPATAPDVPGSMRGVRGIDQNGNAVAESEYMYEICLKCHSGNNQFVPDGYVYVQRLFPQTDKRIAFDTTSASRHPVMHVQRWTQAELPSLLDPYRYGEQYIYCTDCHTNDDPYGPKGPHGSNNPHLLKSEYPTVTEGLCFQCHDETTVLVGLSGRYKHDRHVATRGIPCYACHDPHGSQEYQRLINFAYPSPAGANFAIEPLSVDCPVEFNNDPDRPQCSLSCHVIDPQGNELIKDHTIGGGDGDGGGGGGGGGGGSC